MALSQETGSLLDRMQGVVGIHGAGFVASEGGLAGRRVVVMRSGAGPAAAARATRRLLAGHRPQWVLSAGFAGALADGLATGDLLVASAVVNEHQQAIPTGAADAAAMLTQLPVHHAGRLLSVDHVIESPGDKRRLGQAHDAVAVDMESWAVADVCRTAGVRFLAVRVISDAADDALPREVDHLLRQPTLAGRLGAVTGAVFRRPGVLKDLWRLKETALLGADKLAAFLEALVGRLPQGAG
jgi:adenosylhomocysteine nucleosidase